MANILPPEWFPQDAVMLTWPHARGDWGTQLDAVEHTFIDITKAIAERQTVIISGFNQSHCEKIHNLLTKHKVNLKQIKLYVAPSNDIWARDHGPLTVIDEKYQTTLLDFEFNGWGNKYPYNLDNAVTRTLYQQNAFSKAKHLSIDRVIEGGNIEVNGKGLLLMGRYCALNRNRHPDQDHHLLTSLLKQHLGVEKILWVEGEPLAGDDTDGHVDTMARFCNTNTICYVRSEGGKDINHKQLERLYKDLHELKSLHPQIELIPLPSPRTIYSDDGQVLPATYANFSIINEAVLVPVYDDPQDAVALERFQQLFPKHQLIPINSLALVQQYGSIHCATMQLPQGTLSA